MSDHFNALVHFLKAKIQVDVRLSPCLTDKPETESGAAADVGAPFVSQVRHAVQTQTQKKNPAAETEEELSKLHHECVLYRGQRSSVKTNTDTREVATHPCVQIQPWVFVVLLIFFRAC